METSPEVASTPTLSGSFEQDYTFRKSVDSAIGLSPLPPHSLFKLSA